MWNSSLPSSTFTFGYLVLSIKPPLINCALYYFFTACGNFQHVFCQEKKIISRAKKCAALLYRKLFDTFSLSEYEGDEFYWHAFWVSWNFSNNSLISTGTHNDPVYWISRPYICIVYTLFNGKRRPRYAFSKLCSGSVVGCGKHFITKPFFQL